MGISERRQREKEQRRASIVNAAERVFFRRGLDNATMDEVAVAAEISKGLLYVYFQSKEDLFNAVVLEGLKMLRSSFEDAVGRHRKGLRQAHAIGQAYVVFAGKYPDYFASIVRQAAQNPDPTPDSYAYLCDRERDRIFNIVADTIRTGNADGSVRSDIDPMETAIMLWGQMHGVIEVAGLRNIQDRYHYDFNQLITFSFGFITAALRAQKTLNGKAG